MLCKSVEEKKEKKKKRKKRFKKFKKKKEKNLPTWTPRTLSMKVASPTLTVSITGGLRFCFLARLPLALCLPATSMGGRPCSTSLYKVSAICCPLVPSKRENLHASSVRCIKLSREFVEDAMTTEAMRPWECPLVPSILLRNVDNFPGLLNTFAASRNETKFNTWRVWREEKKKKN